MVRSCQTYSSVWLTCSGRTPKEETIVNEMLVSCSKILSASNFAKSIVCSLFQGT